jgi:carbon-monoxide dehydrogenase medium subunit
VKPAPFAYVAPRTTEAVLDLLGTHGDEAKLLAGGQSLVPLMNFRFASPQVVIDINRIPGLDRIDVGSEVAIGATARHSAVEHSAEVLTAVPMLADALRHVGHVAIRSRGTIGGSIAHADPAAELPAVLLALDGAVVVRGPRGERRIPARELFQGIYTTSLEPEEMIISVHVPITSGGSSIEEVARRHGDFAIAGAVAHIASNSAGEITGARIALFGVDAVPVRADAAEALLLGRRTSDVAAFAEAARVATEPLDPPGHAQFSGAYRKRVAAVVTRRALERAATRSTR